MRPRFRPGRGLHFRASAVNDLAWMLTIAAIVLGLLALSRPGWRLLRRRSRRVDLDEDRFRTTTIRLREPEANKGEDDDARNR